MSYKQVHETFWTDPDVKKYKPMQRYLFGYFITSPHSHYSGLYYCPLVYIQNETGMTSKDIRSGIKFLTDKGHIIYDADREVIFVKSEMLYQLDNIKDGKVILNEKHIKGIKKHFDTLHKSPLIGKFLELYNYLNIDYTGIDRGIDTPMDRDSVTVTVPVIIDRGVGEGSTGKSKTKFGELPNRYVIPPKLEWVVAYCKERKNNVNPRKWHDHYATKGWMVGKTKMVDWQAAVRTWEEPKHHEQDSKDDDLVKGEAILKKMQAEGHFNR